MTLEDIKKLGHRDELHCGTCVKTTGPRGGETFRHEVWRVNGKLITWKTRPGEFKLPVKWGLKTCGYITERNAQAFHAAKECPLLVQPKVLR